MQQTTWFEPFSATFVLPPLVAQTTTITPSHQAKGSSFSLEGNPRHAAITNLSFSLRAKGNKEIAALLPLLVRHLTLFLRCDATRESIELSVKNGGLFLGIERDEEESRVGLLSRSNLVLPAHTPCTLTLRIGGEGEAFVAEAFAKLRDVLSSTVTLSGVWTTPSLSQPFVFVSTSQCYDLPPSFPQKDDRSSS